MPGRMNRRDFLKNAGAVGASGAGYWIAGRQPAFAQEKGPNAKLNVACIGVGGRGRASLDGCKGENIVAVCDVDDKPLDKACQDFPKARRYTDYRKMFEDQKDLKIDAVTVGTPDHHHAPATTRALNLGLHCYVEKPMTATIHEARTLTRMAAEKKVVTQMGNQGHSRDERRQLVEAIQQGVIGKIKEVHAWTNRPIWPQGIDRPKNTPAIPPNVHWDEFLGPAPERPYHPAYHPFKWRGWWDFGTGALGDMACHIMDATYWGLKLGYPTRVEAEGSPLHPETGPQWMIVRLKFPARGELPPVSYTWYDGGKLPPQDLSPVQLEDADGKKRVPNGNLIIGDKGTIFVPDEQSSGWKIHKDGAVIDPKEAGIEKTLPRVPGSMGGHHGEWLTACKGGPPCLGNFDYSGPFTEMVLIGIAAFRSGKGFDWDGPAMKASEAEVAPFITREYRKGWEL